MPKARKVKARRAASARRSSKMRARKSTRRAGPAKEILDPRVQQQVRLYDEAMRDFNAQRFARARQLFDKVAEGFSSELADRARMHIRICEQRLERNANHTPRTPEENYHSGIAMMNLGRWDEAREFLEKARKQAPKAEFVFYALAALDSLTGEADAALTNLKRAIELRPDNRYHARNDEDFQFLLEDPRFTELLYPEREGL
jgi:tetratricopeptide (TPR) repeat protein